ncbi:MAG: hemerythrin domain-containing protein [Candidatus Omnitrophota bacterium]|nr:hemerythrin domain-containing protein [Candidatus Omnitrophota bacterium]
MGQNGNGSAGIAVYITQRNETALKKAGELNDLLTRSRYEGKMHFGRNLDAITRLVAYFDKEFGEHLRLEEEVIYPYLEKHVPKSRSPLAFLRGEHADFRSRLGEIKSCAARLGKQKTDSERSLIFEMLQNTGVYLVYWTRNHLHAENESVYKMIDNQLLPEEKRELSREVTTYAESLAKRN